MTEKLPENPILITKIMSEELRLLWQRKGITVAQFIELQKELPSGITEEMIAGWMSLRIQDVLPSHWNFVVGTWSMFPNVKVRISKFDLENRTKKWAKVAGTSRIEITDEMHAHFLSELKRTGADILIDLVQVDGAPLGFNESAVKILKYRQAKTVRDDYWEFIMRRLSDMPDFSSAR